MKILIILTSILLITGCLPRAMQPPSTGYKSYQSRHPRIDVEQIKRDMTECGFPDVVSYEEYGHNTEGFAQSALCMEKKGYKNAVGKKGICSVPYYRETNACKTTNN